MVSRMRKYLLAPCLFLCCAQAALAAPPSQSGQSGFIQMPSGRINEDGTMQMGFSYEPLYQALWGNVAMLPWLELSGRFTRIKDISGGLGERYGDYKDKAFDAKLLLLREQDGLPSIVFGAQDYLGTGLFPSHYVAAAKRFDAFDVTVGYGSGRLDGLFGGVRYDVPRVEGLSLVAEYNAYDYTQDFAADRSGAAERDKGVGVGIEYQWGWLGSQLSWQDDRWGASAWLSVPLQAPDFIPKMDEPHPYTELHDRGNDEEWARDGGYQQRLLIALRDQGYSAIGIDYAEKTLRLRLGNSRIAHPARAVGRAARTALALGPLQMEQLQIVYTQADLPVVTFRFDDVSSLNAWYQGLINWPEVTRSVQVDYATPTDGAGYFDTRELLAGLQQGPAVKARRDSQSGHLLALEGRQSGWYDVVAVAPRIGFFFNDPSGLVHYDVNLEMAWAKQFRAGWLVDAALMWTMITDMDEVNTRSNSRLPHVRSDITLYRQGSDFKLARAMVNKLVQLDERLYLRAGGGLYEEMFGGAGVQGLYIWDGSHVALDVAIDALQQRDYSGSFGFLDYKTVTAIGSLHVRLPMGVTTVLRGGRFLAGDEGVRLEFRRRFRSGYEIGAWISHTNGNDITSPGSPSDPYQDKGVYFSVPLSTLLTSDTSAEGSYRLRPWTRDGGQMVSPALDLYELVEKPLLLEFPQLREAFEEIGRY